jgi:hypothetical protein
MKTLLVNANHCRKQIIVNESIIKIIKTQYGKMHEQGLAEQLKEIVSKIKKRKRKARSKLV